MHRQATPGAPSAPRRCGMPWQRRSAPDRADPTRHSGREAGVECPPMGGARTQRQLRRLHQAGTGQVPPCSRKHAATTAAGRSPGPLPRAPERGSPHGLTFESRSLIVFPCASARKRRADPEAPAHTEDLTVCGRHLGPPGARRRLPGKRRASITSSRLGMLDRGVRSAGSWASG